MQTIQNSTDLLNYLLQQAELRKDWFGFFQQRLTAISLAHDIAKCHADKMSPSEVVAYAVEINEEIYQKIVRKG